METSQEKGANAVITAMSNGSIGVKKAAITVLRRMMRADEA